MKKPTYKFRGVAYIIAFFALFPCPVGAQTPMSGIDIRADFVGGGVLIEKVAGDTLWLAPDTRNTMGDWFYWYFSAESEVDKEVHFVFPKRKIPSYGPAISLDKGESWEWMCDTICKGLTSFTYSLKAGQEVRFSIGFPYTKVNFDQFIKDHLSSPYVHLDTLCTSLLGTEVPMVFVRNPSNPDRKKIVITARHHACEMMASYALEGIIDELVSERESSRWLRDNFEFLIIPFVDMDGVENGDQGKNRFPRDHNRDYSGESIHETVRAIRSFVPQWSESNLKAIVDLHCPFIDGKGHEVLHLVGSKDEKFAQEEEKFAQILSENLRRGLSFGDSGLLRYGTSWNVESNESLGDTFRVWAQKHFRSVKLAAIFEIPYANSGGQQVSKENLRLMGADFVESLEIYFKTK